jgi:hypothetical protein
MKLPKHKPTKNIKLLIIVFILNYNNHFSLTNKNPAFKRGYDLSIIYSGIHLNTAAVEDSIIKESGVLAAVDQSAVVAAAQSPVPI